MMETPTAERLIDDVMRQVLEHTDLDERRRTMLAGALEKFAAGILAAARLELEAAKPAYPIPGPYEIALRVGAAVAGRTDDVNAAMMQGWAAVPAFYAGRDFFLTELAPMLAAVHAPGSSSRADA